MRKVQCWVGNTTESLSAETGQLEATVNQALLKSTAITDDRMKRLDLIEKSDCYFCCSKREF
jgi:hypothetical protein